MVTAAEALSSFQFKTPGEDLVSEKGKKQNKTYSDNEKHANENIKKKNTNENGTYEYSSNISTSTKTMIPVLEM